jgi:succinoglycan biosynthesis transport protein ExoP
VTITQYVRLLRDRWVTVLLPTVLGTLGAAAFSSLSMPVYEARTQLFVSTSGQSASLGELAQGSTFTQQRVKSYTDLLTSPRVLQPVISALDLDTTAEDLGDKITATSRLDTVLIDITVRDTSPVRAADIGNAVAVQFPKLVNELETRPGQKVSPVKVTVTRPATPETAPVSPRTTLNLALGLLVGLGLGVGTAALRDSLDRTVSGRTQVSQLVGAPVLGTVIDDQRTPSTPLISRDAFSPRAEAFRQLRTNIRFLSVDHRVSSMVVTGSVQAEGKTTTAANLAIALAQNGERVVLVDADLRRPAVAELFGVPGGIGLTTVLLGDTGVDTALQRWRDDLPLFLLTAGPLPPNPSELIGSARMAELVHHLTGHGMTVLVDSPPLLPVTDAAILARVTDGALVVTRTGSTKVEQLTTAVEALRTAGAPVLGVVLNRVPKRGRPGEPGSYGHSPSSYAPQPAAPLAPMSMPPMPPMSTPPMPPMPTPPMPPMSTPPMPAMPAMPAPVLAAAPSAVPQPDPRPEIVDLRQPAGHRAPADGSPADGSHVIDRPGLVNGPVSTLVNGRVNGQVNGRVSPYQQDPQTRPHGRRSATPPDPQP